MGKTLLGAPGVSQTQGVLGRCWCSQEEWVCVATWHPLALFFLTEEPRDAHSGVSS